MSDSNRIIRDCVEALDWDGLRAQLDTGGHAVTAAARGTRDRHGYHRIVMRHGVSTVTRGRRTALGIIFHDSR